MDILLGNKHLRCDALGLVWLKESDFGTGMTRVCLSASLCADHAAFDRQQLGALISLSV